MKENKKNNNIMKGIKEENKNPKQDQKNKEKVSLAYNMEIAKMDAQNNIKGGYDFVPKDYHWTNPDEQKIKTREIEEKTEE